MAKKEILVSDLTGQEINGGRASIKIQLSSKPNSSFFIDASEDEVAELIASAREAKKRGRKPKKV